MHSSKMVTDRMLSLRISRVTRLVRMLYELDAEHALISFIRVPEGELRNQAMNIIFSEGLTPEEYELFKSDAWMQIEALTRYCVKLSDAIRCERNKKHT